MQQLNIDVISNRNVGIVFHDDLNICEPHSHTFFELAYIISGNAIHTLNGKSDVVKSGEYVFIEPGSIHFFEKTNQQEWYAPQKLDTFGGAYFYGKERAKI